MAHTPASASEEVPFLPALAQAAQRVLAEGQGMSTEAFAALIDVVVRIFDHLGRVLAVAKPELVAKVSTLHVAAPSLPSLEAVVQHDKAAGRATVKDSCTRNLHRLLYVVKFMRVLLQQLMSSPSVTLKHATGKAYEQSLAQIHPWVVRTAVNASLMLLPSREDFLHKLGETEQSAAQWAAVYLESTKDVEAHVLALYNGIKMPTATTNNNILAAIWGKASTPSEADGTSASTTANTREVAAASS